MRELLNQDQWKGALINSYIFSLTMREWTNCKKFSEFKSKYLIEQYAGTKIP